MSLKQVIVMRVWYPDGKGGWFKPPLGKLIAQGAHASMKVFFERAKLGVSWPAEHPEFPMASYFEPGGNPEGDAEESLLVSPITEEMRDWFAGVFTKICVRADSEEQLLDLYRQAQEAKIPCALITDNGTTVFKGVPTNTCIAIGPDYPERVDEITGDLKLL